MRVTKGDFAKMYAKVKFLCKIDPEKTKTGPTLVSKQRDENGQNMLTNRCLNENQQKEAGNGPINNSGRYER